MAMTVEMIDGIRVIKLRDSASGGMDAAQDMRAVAYIHMLLGGAHGARDTAIYSRRMV
jgi:hypothetical protein